MSWLFPEWSHFIDIVGPRPVLRVTVPRLLLTCDEQEEDVTRVKWRPWTMVRWRYQRTVALLSSSVTRITSFLVLESFTATGRTGAELGLSVEVWILRDSCGPVRNILNWVSHVPLSQSHQYLLSAENNSEKLTTARAGPLQKEVRTGTGEQDEILVNHSSSSQNAFLVLNLLLVGHFVFTN